MKQLTIGDITITSIIERDGPWRKPEDMFPAYDPDIGRRHLAALDKEVFDPVSGKMVITYQTYVVRTPKHTILVDTCTGEDKGYPPPMDFPKQPWLDGFRAAGLRFEDIDVFCTHLHIDHTGWNTMLRNGRWVSTSRRPNTSSTKANMPRGRRKPNAAAIGPAAVAMCGRSIASRWSRPGKRFWSTTIISSTNALVHPDAGPFPCHCCVNIRSRGQQAIVVGDLMHHALQCREPDWSTVFDWTPRRPRFREKILKRNRRHGRFVLPIHFPHPTTGLIEADGERFHYKFVR